LCKKRAPFFRLLQDDPNKENRGGKNTLEDVVKLAARRSGIMADEDPRLYKT
jgi:hypothetical protein